MNRTAPVFEVDDRVKTSTGYFGRVVKIQMRGKMNDILRIEWDENKKGEFELTSGKVTNELASVLTKVD